MTHHLTILAGDAAFGETFAQWANADLMDAAGFVDLRDAEEELDAPVLWTRSGNTSRTTLEEVGTLERWDPVTFVWFLRGGTVQSELGVAPPPRPDADRGR